MRFKTSDRVIYLADGPDYGVRGTVTLITGEYFEVSWDDGQTYSYQDWAGSSIDKIRRRKALTTEQGE